MNGEDIALILIALILVLPVLHNLLIIVVTIFNTATEQVSLYRQRRRYNRNVRKLLTPKD